MLVLELALFLALFLVLGVVVVPWPLVLVGVAVVAVVLVAQRKVGFAVVVGTVQPLRTSAAALPSVTHPPLGIVVPIPAEAGSVRSSQGDC